MCEIWSPSKRSLFLLPPDTREELEKHAHWIVQRGWKLPGHTLPVVSPQKGKPKGEFHAPPSQDNNRTGSFGSRLKDKGGISFSKRTPQTGGVPIGSLDFMAIWLDL